MDFIQTRTELHKAASGQDGFSVRYAKHFGRNGLLHAILVIGFLCIGIGVTVAFFMQALEFELLETLSTIVLLYLLVGGAASWFLRSKLAKAELNDEIEQEEYAREARKLDSRPPVHHVRLNPDNDLLRSKSKSPEDSGARSAQETTRQTSKPVFYQPTGQVEREVKPEEEINEHTVQRIRDEIRKPRPVPLEYD